MKLVARRKIPFRKQGKKIVFLDRELETYLDGLPGIKLDEWRIMTASHEEGPCA